MHKKLQERYFNQLCYQNPWIWNCIFCKQGLKYTCVGFYDKAHTIVTLISISLVNTALGHCCYSSHNQKKKKRGKEKTMKKKSHIKSLQKWKTRDLKETNCGVSTYQRKKWLSLVNNRWLPFWHSLSLKYWGEIFLHLSPYQTKRLRQTAHDTLHPPMWARLVFYIYTTNRRFDIKRTGLEKSLFSSCKKEHRVQKERKKKVNAS